VRSGRRGGRGGGGGVAEAAAPAGGGGREKAEGVHGDRGGGGEVRDAHGAAARHRGRHGGGDGARAARRPPRAAQDAHQLRRQPPHRVIKEVLRPLHGCEPRVACSCVPCARSGRKNRLEIFAVFGWVIHSGSGSVEMQAFSRLDTSYLMLNPLTCGLDCSRQGSMEFE
jgi:hypothetical protein